MRRVLLLVSLLCPWGFGQTFTYPALSTDNTFTGTNTFTGVSLFKLLNGIRFADQYASIQAAVTAAGTNGSVIIPANYAGTDTYTNPSNINIIDLRGKPDRYKGFVNVVSDCSVVGDGVTDDTTAIQNCINNNPGRKIFFPKMCASQSGGNSFSCVDYKITSPLTTSGNGQWLDGEIPGGPWQGGPVIQQFTADTSGIIIPAAGYGQKITNFEIIGQGWPALSGGSTSCWTDSDTATWPQNGSADGIYVGGAEPTIENVKVKCFNRHGVNIDGSQGGQQPDHWLLKNLQLNGMGGDGLFIHGADSSAGMSELLNIYSANGWGIRDLSVLGNTHIAPETQGVHRNAGIAAGSSINISTVSRASNVVTVVTSTNHGFTLGKWVALTFVTDGSFNGVFKVTSVANSTTFTFNQVAPNASSGSGTVKTESGANVYANAQRTFQKCSINNASASLSCSDANFYDDHQPGAAVTVAGAGVAGANLVTTISTVNNGYNAVLAATASTTVSNVAATVGGGWGGGPYNGKTAGTNQWFNPYMESNQPQAKMDYSNIVIGGNFPANFDLSYGEPLQIRGGSTNQFDAGNGAFRFNRPRDAALAFGLQAGLTADQDTYISFKDHNGSDRAEIRSVAGSYALWLKDSISGNIPFAISSGNNSTVLLRAQGNGTLQLNEGGGNLLETGTTFQCSGSGTCNLGAASHGFGTGLFTGQVTSTLATGTAPLSIASTTLVPNLNTQVLNGVTVSGAAANGNVLTASSSSAAAWQAPVVPVVNFAWGGDGSDGAITADGSTTLTCLGAPAASVYTLTRSCFFTTLTVNNGVTIKSNNFAIFVTGTLTNAGNINNDGAVGNAGANSGGSAGGSGGGTVVAAGSNSGVYARLLGSVAGTAGGTGQTTAGSQAPAANGGNNSTAGVDSSGVAGATGSSGGKGGDGNPNAGGALRTGGSGGTIPSIPGMSGHHQNNAFWGGYHQAAATTWSTYSAPNAGNGGAPGGSGGGGDGANAGGGGGGGGSEGGYGGMVGIFAKTISNSGTISSNGGTGGAGGNGRTPGAGNTGGGGGGAGGSGGIGGIVWLVYQTISNSGTISANGGGSSAGGAKGLPAGSGVDNAAAGSGGPSGPAGIVIQIVSQ